VIEDLIASAFIAGSFNLAAEPLDTSRSTSTKLHTDVWKTGAVASAEAALALQNRSRAEEGRDQRMIFSEPFW
jgi:hypothetical protein